MRAFVVLLVAGALAGCASESLPEPEPTLFTPGAFVAVDSGDGPLALSRTLSTFAAEDDTIVLFTDYDVAPADWEEAEELAKGPDLPVLFAAVPASGKLFMQSDYRVVWFRTLTEEEKERIQ